MKKIRSRMNDLETPFLIMNEEITQKLANLTIIHTEGNISSGKTSLCDLIRDRYRYDKRIQVINEPVELFLDYRHYNCLKSLEESPKEQAALTQALFIRLLSRYYIATFHELPPETRVIITDRYITSAEIFINTLEEKGFITYLNKITLLDFLRDYTHNIPRPHLIFHLKREPEWCLQNVQKRERIGEQHFCSLEYLTILERQIREFITEGPEDLRFSEGPTPYISTSTTNRRTLLTEITNIINYTLEKGDRKTYYQTIRTEEEAKMHRTLQRRISDHSRREGRIECDCTPYISESNKYERQRLKNLARSMEKLQYKSHARKTYEEGQNTHWTPSGNSTIVMENPNNAIRERKEIMRLRNERTHAEIIPGDREYEERLLRRKEEEERTLQYEPHIRRSNRERQSLHILTPRDSTIESDGPDDTLWNREEIIIPEEAKTHIETKPRNSTREERQSKRIERTKTESPRSATNEETIKSIKRSKKKGKRSRKVKKMNKKRRRKAAEEQKERQQYKAFIASLNKGGANSMNTD